jgi:hypothetical protein
MTVPNWVKRHHLGLSSRNAPLTDNRAGTSPSSKLPHHLQKTYRKLLRDHRLDPSLLKEVEAAIKSRRKKYSAIERW